MKKVALIIAISFFATTKCLAQDKGLIGISIGPSIPIGDFASKDSNNDSAGIAKTGAIFDISFMYLLGKTFGVTAMIRAQANSVDTNVLEKELSRQGISSIYTNVETGNWSLGSLLVGGYGSFPISSRVSFQPKIMIGFASVTSPTIDIYLDNGSESGYVKQESADGSSFAYLFGTAFKFNVGKRISLLANFDYLGTKTEFNDVEIFSSDGSIIRNTWSQPIQTINIGVGVGYRL